MNSLKGIELADYFIGVSGRTKEIADGYYDEVVDAVCRRVSGVPTDADLVLFNNGANHGPTNDIDARVMIFAEVMKDAEDIKTALISALGCFSPDVLDTHEGLSSFGLMRVEYAEYELSDYRNEFRRALGDKTIHPLGTFSEDGCVSRGRISDVPVKAASGSN